jgi:arsenate reductase-like glutaredoxin family protein
MTIDPQLSKEIKDFIENQVEKKVKSIQVKYLKENFMTKDDFQDYLKYSDKHFENVLQKMENRFDAMDKRFETIQEQMDKRFKVMQKQMDERFEPMDKRFIVMQKQMDERFDKVYTRFDQLDFGHTDVVEGLAYTVIKREFRKRGLEFKLTKNHHFDDEEKIVHPDTTDVDINIFNINPNVIAEATLKVTDIEKIRTFIRKIKFIEKKKQQKFNRYFFCYMIYDSIQADVERLLEQYDIELIMPDKE